MEQRRVMKNLSIIAINAVVLVLAGCLEPATTEDTLQNPDGGSFAGNNGGSGSGGDTSKDKDSGGDTSTGGSSGSGGGDSGSGGGDSGSGGGGDSGSGGGGDSGGGSSFDLEFSASVTSGVIPVQVEFSAPQHSEISEYRWDFDDGSAATGRTSTHTFSESGTYNVTLTATANDGTQYTAEERINAFESINNADAIVPGTALFFDSFEYEAGRDDSGVTSVFVEHGWSAVKTQQVMPERHPLGYIYTTDTVPGYEGNMLPGANSQSVLAMEALPTTLGEYEGPDTFWGNMQTDFYLQFGDGNQSGAVPANVWFQFWLYTTGGRTGGFVRTQNKFLYPCRGSYPCQDNTWIAALGTTSANPHWVELGDATELPVPDAYLRVESGSANWSPGHDAEHELGHTDASEYILGQRWVLVKIHIDTSGPQGVYEAWMRPMGGREVKVAEHIGGVTPGFNWPVDDNSGHRVLRMPTTIGNRNVVENYPESYDVTFYMDDFTIATSEEDLPVYPY